MDDIVNYVMNTPANTNPNVLKGLLDKVGGGSGGGSGYTVEETRTTIIPEQTVTTVDDEGFIGALLTLASGLTYYPKAGDTLSVTINGETKDVVGVENATSDGPVFFFSGSLPDDIPAIIVGIAPDTSALVTVALPPATYTISAELVTRTVTVSPEFQEARGYVVDDAAKGDVIMAEETLTVTAQDMGGEYAEIVASASYDEIMTMPDAIIVTINGTSYKIPKGDSPDEYTTAYGFSDAEYTPNFVDYPVNIYFSAGEIWFAIPSVGEYTISINAATKAVTTTPDFDAAVVKSTEPLVLTLVPTNPSAPFSGTVTGATAVEIREAWYSGRVITAQFGGVQIRFSAASDDLALSLYGFIVYLDSTLGNPFVQFVITAETMTYSSGMFSGLTLMD